MGHFFSLFVFADHILAMCHILNGHKESTSLFEAVEGKVAEKAAIGRRDRKGGRKGSCRRSGAEKVATKVAVAEIVGKANPRKKKEKEEDIQAETFFGGELLDLRSFF